MLGGDHSITWPSASAVAQARAGRSIGIVHFDAHADTGTDQWGVLAGHGQPMRRLIESGAVAGRNFVQVGLRGYWPSPEVFEWMKAQGMRWHLMREIDYSCYAGASAFLSTPSDLVRFGMAIDSGKLLQPATVQLLQTSQRLPSGEETGYGLGWDLETVTLAGEQTRVAGHDGESLGGMVASLMTLRERGLVVAVASNISYADTSAIALKVAEAFAGQGSPGRK